MNAPVLSWRPEAVRALAAQWTGDQPLTVLRPESRHGERADRYGTQVDWETATRAAASAILFWISATCAPAGHQQGGADRRSSADCPSTRCPRRRDPASGRGQG